MDGRDNDINMRQEEPPDPGNLRVMQSQNDRRTVMNRDDTNVSSQETKCNTPKGFGTLKEPRVKVSDGLAPQIAGSKAQSVCDSLGFSNNFCAEAIGASGGMWLLWNACNIDLQIIDDTAHFIHAKVNVMRSSYHFIVVYGPTSARRVRFWEELDNAIAAIDEPCFYRGCMELIDMGFSGSKFTWLRGLAEAPSISKRLDGFLMNISARVCWEEASVRHLPAVRSDHNPLLLSLMSSTHANAHCRSFRF
ncbi:hypothetical protein V2J09_007114 [Rumex salicifolius]